MPKTPMFDLRNVRPEDINKVFDDAIAASKGFRIADAFAPERVDALAKLMGAMDQPMDQKTVDELKAKSKKT